MPAEARRVWFAKSFGLDDPTSSELRGAVGRLKFCMPRIPVNTSDSPGFHPASAPAVGRGIPVSLIASACSLALHGGMAVAIWQAPRLIGTGASFGADAWSGEPMVLVSWNDPPAGSLLTRPEPLTTETVPRETQQEVRREQPETPTVQLQAPEPIIPEPVDRLVERLGRDVDLPPTRAWVGSDVEGINRGVSSSVDQGAASRQPGMPGPQEAGRAGVVAAGSTGGAGGVPVGDTAQASTPVQAHAVTEARVVAPAEPPVTEAVSGGERPQTVPTQPLSTTVTATTSDMPPASNQGVRSVEPVSSVQGRDQQPPPIVEARTDGGEAIQPAAPDEGASPMAVRPADVLGRLREWLPSIDRVAGATTRERAETADTTPPRGKVTPDLKAAPDQVSSAERPPASAHSPVRPEPVGAVPAAPGPASARPGASASASPSSGDPGPLADRDSDAASVLFRGVYQWGSVLVGEGLEVRTVRPRFTLTARYLTVPQNPVLRISFGKDGTVRRVVLLRSSGFREERDEPIINAVYKWTASGRAIRELPDTPGATVTIEMTILLN